MAVGYKTRCWCEKFGAGFVCRLKSASRKPGKKRHLDEVLVTLGGEPYLLWHAVNQHGAEFDSSCRNVGTRRQPSGF